MAQGIGGFMSLTGMPDGEPTRAGVPVSDIFTGVYSVIGILAALARRERTGHGGFVDTALVDSTVGVLANQALNYLVSSKVPQRIGNAHPNIVPYQVFPVADGHIIIATGNDSQYAKLCGVLGAPELAKEPAYKDNTCRLANRGALIERLSALTVDLPQREALWPSSRPRRAGRADQRPRPGVRRPAGGASRHEASTCRAQPPRAARSRACARRSCSTASRWRPSALPRGSASIPRRSCARSARARAFSDLTESEGIPLRGKL